MAFSASITELDSYKEYLTAIQKVPSKQLAQAFECGLPAIWMYMKTIGLEDVFFDLLKDVKNKPELFKELFYLLMLTSDKSKFFPHVPEKLLNVEIPAKVRDAFVEINDPEFEMAHSFTRADLIETLKAVALPNKMIRLGTKMKSVGVMYSNNHYHLYHADNPHALEFKDLDRCVDLIMEIMK